MHPNDRNPADGLGLIPVTILAFGHPTRPVERLIGLQAAVGRFIAWIAALQLPRSGSRTVNPIRIFANRQPSLEGDPS
jgi:hypothetical protein